MIKQIIIYVISNNIKRNNKIYAITIFVIKIIFIVKIKYYYFYHYIAKIIDLFP